MSSGPSIIGNFLINFGTLEYLVNVYLKDHIDSDEFSKVKEGHLKDRLSRIARHLDGTDCSPQAKEEFENFVTRLDPIRDLRNHIAHGHLLLRENKETHRPEIFIARSKDLDQEYSPDVRHVTFEELQASLTELTGLIETFKKIVGFEP